MIDTSTTNRVDADIDELDKLKKDLYEAKEEYNMRFVFIVGSSKDRGDQRGGYNLFDKHLEPYLYDSVIKKYRDDAEMPWVNVIS